MTLTDKVNSFFTAGLTATSIFISADAIAHPNDDICKEVAKCSKDNPKKPSKPACETLYNGRGMCLTDTVAESLGAVGSTAGYCKGPETQLCYDTTNIPNIVDALKKNSLAIIELRKQHAGLKKTVKNFINSSEQLHRVMGRALQPELDDLEQKQALYETMCQPAANKENCLPAWFIYQTTVNHLVEKIRQNLLDTPENERSRISLLIDGRLNGLFREVLGAAKDIVDKKTAKVSLGLHAGYAPSIFNADSKISHNAMVGGNVSIYFPPSGLSVGLTGSYVLGTSLEYQSIFGPFTKISAGEDSSDSTTSRGTIYTSTTWRGSLGFFTDKYLLGSPLDAGSLALRFGESISWGNQKITTNANTTTQFYKADGTPEGPVHNVNGSEAADKTVVRSTTYGGLSACYNKMGPLSACVNGTVGLGVTAEETPQVSVEPSLGITINYNFF